MTRLTLLAVLLIAATGFTACKKVVHEETVVPATETEVQPVPAPTEPAPAPAPVEPAPAPTPAE